eukprot:TRINITY_DN9431_c0_g1_i1.p1 TRINITY_DN9431_c0_g1~~TRINITY_DN9431_c0_g1_i1.p1  ORF type:complete len:169 (+),score=75.02 TRINITY_DN9431_c0_g1_i1:70-576(+)
MPPTVPINHHRLGEVLILFFLTETHNHTMSLSAEDQKEIKQAFNFADKDKDGKIGPNEIAYVLRAIGYAPSEKDIKNFNEKNGNKSYDFDSFVKAIPDFKKVVADEVIQAFKKFDKDRTGVVVTHELRHALLTVGEKFTDAEAEAFVKLAGSEKINYKDFMSVMAHYK